MGAPVGADVVQPGHVGLFLVFEGFGMGPEYKSVVTVDVVDVVLVGSWAYVAVIGIHQGNLEWKVVDQADRRHRDDQGPQAKRLTASHQEDDGEPQQRPHEQQTRQTPCPHFVVAYHRQSLKRLGRIQIDGE